MAKPSKKSTMTVGKIPKKFESEPAFLNKKKKDIKKKISTAEKKALKPTSRKSKVNENFMIMGFIKSLIDKKYSQSDKYLQGQVDKLVTDKIKKAVETTTK